MSRARDRYIKELELTARSCEAHAPYISLAEEIRRHVNEESAQWGADFDGHMDNLIRRMTAQERQRMLIEQFRALPLQSRLKMLGAHFTDDETREALRDERDRMLGRDKLERALIGIRSEYETSGRINLAQVPKDAVLGIGLHDTEDFDGLDQSSLEEDSWADRYVKAASLGGGSYRIISDQVDENWDPDDYLAKPSLRPSEVVRLGGALALDSEAAYDIYFGGALEVGRGNKTRSVYLKHDYDSDENVTLGIGSVRINNIDIIAPPSPEE